MMWKCGAFEFDSRVPVIMGILNVTPDSYSDGGAHADFASAVKHARAMVDAGAQIIDVGGESTRPGAAEVSVEEELSRVLDVVRQLADLGICVSIDTRHAEVAQACVEAGAAIINDVTGFSDPAMVDVALGCDAGLVVMHMKGDPATMQDDPQYDDVVTEVRDYLAGQASKLEAAGVARERICVDPGPGFGKTASQTMELMRNLHEICRLGYPTMCAVSRKSYIGAAYGIENPADRDQASASEALAACELGASVVRAHNVEATAASLKDSAPLCTNRLGVERCPGGQSRRGDRGQDRQPAAGHHGAVLHSRHTDYRYLQLLRERARLLRRPGRIRECRGACAHRRAAERAAAIPACHRGQPGARTRESRMGRARSTWISSTTRCTW